MNEQVKEILKPLEDAMTDVKREIEYHQSQGKLSLGKQMCLKSMRKAYYQIANIISLDKWINIDLRPPEKETTVIAYTVEDGIIYGMYIDEDGEWVSRYFRWSGGRVTHWMPLPKPPVAK